MTIKVHGLIKENVTGITAVCAVKWSRILMSRGFSRMIWNYPLFYDKGGDNMLKSFSLILIGISIISRAVVFFSYEKILRDSDKPAEGKGVLSIINKRYTYLNELNTPIRNTEAFVCKNIIENTMLKTLIPTVDTFGYILTLFSIGIMLYSENNIDITVMSGAITFLITDKMINKEEKMKLAVSNITDYLDNTVANRLINKRELRNERNENIKNESIIKDRKADRDKIGSVRLVNIKGGDVSEIKLNEISPDEMEMNRQDITYDMDYNNIESVIKSGMSNEAAEEIINEVLREYLV